MQVDFLQVGTNLIIAAMSAWLAGKLGIRQGLERGKRERAFDRRLAWYEKTYRLISRFISISLDTSGSADILSCISQLKKCACELEECLNEAAMFAERKILKELTNAESAVNEIIFDATIAAENSSDDLQIELRKKLTLFPILLRELNFDLAQSIRNQLSLDIVSREDVTPQSKSILDFEEN